MNRRRIREYKIPEVYDVSVCTVRRWAGEGRLHPSTPSPRIKLYDVEELEKVLDGPKGERKPVAVPWSPPITVMIWPQKIEKLNHLAI
jgi:hypothetical protein